MNEGIFSFGAFREALLILRDEIPFAVWETFYVTVVSTLFAAIIGLPLRSASCSRRGEECFLFRELCFVF